MQIAQFRSVLAGACLLGAFLAWGVFGPTTARAASPQPDPQPAAAEVHVVGVGTVRRAPDTAILSLAVSREAETAREAVSAANEAMSAVIQRMRDAGVADRDLQTQDFSIQPRIEYPDEKGGPRTPRVVGYEARNSLTVRVRDLGKVGVLLDEAITLGVNRGGDVRFVNEDPAEALAQARAEAMRDARERARTLVGALGMRLGRVVSVRESQASPRPQPMAATRMVEMANDAGGEVPLSAGESSYTVRVEARWEIDP